MYYGPALRGDQAYQLPRGIDLPVEPQQQRTDLSSLLGPLLRRWRLFVAVFLIFVGLVLLFTLLAHRTYTTSVKMIAGNSNPGVADRSGGDTAYPLLNAILFSQGVQTSETYAELLQESPVVNQVIDDLHLNIDASSLLSRHVDIKPVTNTAVLSLDVTWSDPNTSAKIANDFANVFVNRERELIAQQAGSALDFLGKQIPQAESKMHEADNALARFQSAHPNVYINTAPNNTIDTAISSAQQKFAQVQVDAGQAQAQLANINGQLANMSPTVNGSSNVNQNPVVAQLQTQLAQVNVQLDAARKQYTEQHPTVIGLEQQKTQLEKEISSQPATIVAGNSYVPNPVYQQLTQQAATLRAQIASDQAQMATLTGLMSSNSASGQNLPRETIELADLQRKAKLAEDVYNALLQKQGDATVARTTALSDVAITQPASAAAADVKPKLILNLMFGLGLGLILAISAVYIVDFFDNTFKNEQDVQRILPLPLLTTVPELTTRSTRGLPWLRALTIESFLQLVTALRYSSDKPLRTLAISSPNQGDGKSTVALSTAIAMAEMEPGVVLIDADMRRPSLGKRLNLESAQGLSDVLVGAARLEEVIQKTKYDGLSFLSSGTKVPNPMKLLQSASFDTLVKRLLEQYRAIVFDTPALLPVYDAALVAAKVDGTVLVVSANVTDTASTKKALQRLGTLPEVNILGVVLNRVAQTNGYKNYYLNGDAILPLPQESEPDPGVVH